MTASKYSSRKHVEGVVEGRSSLPLREYVKILALGYRDDGRDIGMLRYVNLDRDKDVVDTPARTLDSFTGKSSCPTILCEGQVGKR